MQNTHAGHISFLPVSEFVVDPVSDLVSSELSMPESRLIADGGGIGCGLLFLRLVGDEFCEEFPDDEVEGQDDDDDEEADEFIDDTDELEVFGSDGGGEAILATDDPDGVEAAGGVVNSKLAAGAAGEVCGA